MKLWNSSLGALALACAIACAAAQSQAEDQSADELALQRTEVSVLELRRQLFGARRRGDEDRIKELSKQFDAAQKERARLLRKTWQM